MKYPRCRCCKAECDAQNKPLYECHKKDDQRPFFYCEKCVEKEDMVSIGKIVWPPR